MLRGKLFGREGFTLDTDMLKLENQLCFPLYAAAKGVVKQYKPFLDAIDLTYTQYIAMMVLWEKKSASVKELGEKLYLDSGTLTPLLKKLEKKSFVTRDRSTADERSLVVAVTEKGMELREKAKGIPMQMGQCLRLESGDARELYRILYELLSHIEPSDSDAMEDE